MCDCVVVVTPHRVLFAKNSDRDANEAQGLEWREHRSHPAGSAVRCTWIEIPQARQTHAALLSRPFWMWGAEMGANEHGVVVGNTAVFTTRPRASLGLTGMDLVRLAVERADSRRAAVETIVSLLEAYGQGGGCGHEDRTFSYHSAFLVADRGGATLVETAGRAWETREVDSGVCALSNALTIPGFAALHTDRLRTWGADARPRRARVGLKAAFARSAGDLFAVLRDHGDRAPRYSMLNGALAAPCVHAGGLVASTQTTASWVSELGPDGDQHWVTATAAPCTGLFKPVRVGRSLRDAALRFAATDHRNPETLWWRHERLHRSVMRSPAALLPLLTPERDEVEARWLRSPPDPDRAFAEGDRLLEKWTSLVSAAPVPDSRPLLVRRYWEERQRRAAGSRGPAS